MKNRVGDKLLAWYRVHKRSLPWRRTRDPYKIWISEVMLQQTTVSAVIPYYERWLKVFPDMRSLARAPLRRVLREWQGLGYYQRAGNLHRAAKIIEHEHGGRVPDNEPTLRRLPGFGPYTTAAVLSLAYGRPLPVVDANVRRVLMRVLGLRGAAEARIDESLGAFLETIFPKDSPGDFNQAMMELGALVCRSRNPQCLACPLRASCRAAREGTQEIIPRPRKLRLEKIEAVVAIMEKDGRFLIQKRPAGGLLADLWEFPGGKVEPGESLPAALRREVREELGVEIKDVRRLTTVRHAYTRFQVTLHAYTCKMRDSNFKMGSRRRWVTLSSIRRYPLPSGSVKIVDFLAAHKDTTG
ncbi:MAG: A/G-specific adenine glycosylase [Candidatus Aminicenantes bacterium RBG_16_63_14]|nr:MAG: A/G-specific adenine glycosylase [Candidatus Aminicenantes bacterium RBG_16_63_14]